MKISIALAILILVLAAAFGWHDHERLASVRASHAALVAEAAALGTRGRRRLSGHYTWEHRLAPLARIVEGA